MSTLALRLQPSEFETATSWASRLSERNGCSRVQDFVHDMGISWKAFRTGNLQAITSLCELAGVSPEIVHKHAYRVGDNATEKWIGDEWIAPNLLRFDRLTICPDCVSGSFTEDYRYLTRGAHVWWAIEGFRVCPIHDRPLVSLEPTVDERCKHDFSGRVRDNLDLVRSHSSSRTSLKAGVLEHYIMNRLKLGTGKSGRWIDALDLATVVRASERLGLVAMGHNSRPQKTFTEETMIVASAKGFELLCKGPKRLVTELQRLKSERGSRSFFSDFFPFSYWVERLQKNGHAAPLTDCVREFIICNYPCAAGEKVLGKVTAERRIHTISSAAQVADVTVPRMRKALAAAQRGDSLQHLPRPDMNLWVRASDWNPWLKEFGHAITQEPAAQRLGVSPSTFTQLVASGFLEPVAEVQDMADRYLPETIDGLLVDATGYAKPVSVAPNDLVPLNTVQSFCKAKMTEVLSLLINHQLESVARLEGSTGLNGIFVSKQEVLDQLEGPPLEGLGSDKVRRYLRINALTVPWLAKKKLLKPERVLHPRTKKLVHLYRHSEVDRFLEAYETAGRLAKRLNLSPQKTVAMLKQEGLEPLPVKRNMSAIFLKKELPTPYL